MSEKNHAQSFDDVVVGVNVSVDVYPAEKGMLGNTASGKYVFVLDKDVVHVDAPDVRTEVFYTLTDDALQRGFSFVAAYISDPRSQLIGPHVMCRNESNPCNRSKLPDTIRFIHSNTHASLISISLQVKDSNNPDKLVAYDPEITNDPGN